MKNFMDENFLLQTETAQKLYHEHAAKMPIIDYHCHLIPQMVADDYKFKSLAVTITNGVQCVLMVETNASVREKPQIGKSSKNGRKQCLIRSVIHYTTGLIWS